MLRVTPLLIAKRQVAICSEVQRYNAVEEGSSLAAILNNLCVQRAIVLNCQIFIIINHQEDPGFHYPGQGLSTWILRVLLLAALVPSMRHATSELVTLDCPSMCECECMVVCLNASPAMNWSRVYPASRPMSSRIGSRRPTYRDPCNDRRWMDQSSISRTGKSDKLRCRILERLSQLVDPHVGHYWAILNNNR